jgi:hypothetical protein
MLSQTSEMVRSFKRFVAPSSNRKLVDMATMPKKLCSLSEEELDELAHFGSIMIQELVNRIPQLETKAAIVFGYGGALIVFLLTALRWWPPSALLRAGFLLVAACSGAAVLLAARAMALKGGWNWPSERDWFPEKTFGNLHAMKRRHLNVLLLAHQTQGHVADRKAIDILWAQRLLVAAIIALAIVFIVAVVVAALENLVGIWT